MSGRFYFFDTPIKGLYKIDHKSILDERGYFSRLFCNEDFKEIGFDKSIVQINYTLTKQKGAVRGMHFQYHPYTETKIVTCLKGKVLDIAIDIRSNSKTFLQYYALQLSDENGFSLYIPSGFAHGFQTLTEDCQLLYLHTSIYAKNSEGGLNALDPKLGIKWPLKITEISKRDNNLKMLDENFKGITIP